MNRTTDQICDTLRSHNIILDHVGGSDDSYWLQHQLSDEQFHEVMVALCRQHNLKPQDVGGFPGNPCFPSEPNDKSADSFGYYVCPVDPTEYDEDGAFDMFISYSEFSWC